MHVPVVRAEMGGGAIAMCRLAARLAAHGHTVRLTASSGVGRRVYGLRVERLAHPSIARSDVMMVAAGSRTLKEQQRARRMGVPVVCFVHSAVNAAWMASVRTGAKLVVWGSAALEARAHATGQAPACPSMVMWPLINPEAVRVPAPGTAVTLVNLLREKGAELFWRIVEAMPDVEFLGVRGGWHRNQQLVPAVLPSNATVMSYSNPRNVYARTRVLLYMRGATAGPAWLNGVGMTALEAAVSGIPTIAHPGPGLVESLGASGTWVDSDEVEPWCYSIRSVLANWEAKSRAALHRAQTLDDDAAVRQLVARVRELGAVHA